MSRYHDGTNIGDVILTDKGEVFAAVRDQDYGFVWTNFQSGYKKGDLKLGIPNPTGKHIGNLSNMHIEVCKNGIKMFLPKEVNNESI